MALFGALGWHSRDLSRAGVMQSKDVEFYREQAKRMRQIGANAASLDITMQLVAIAQQFERLADFVEREMDATAK